MSNKLSMTPRALQNVIYTMAFIAYGLLNFVLPDLSPNDVTLSAIERVVFLMQIRAVGAGTVALLFAIPCVLLFRRDIRTVRSIAIIAVSVVAIGYGFWRWSSGYRSARNLESAYRFSPIVEPPENWMKEPRRSPIHRVFTDPTSSQQLLVWAFVSNMPRPKSKRTIDDKSACLKRLLESTDGALAGLGVRTRSPISATEYEEIAPIAPVACRVRMVPIEGWAGIETGVRPCPAVGVDYYFLVLSGTKPIANLELERRIGCPK